jgi:predicted phage terminase large subunit-like protein
MTKPERDVMDAVLRRNIAAFSQRCFFQLHPGKELQSNWHIDALTYHMQLVHTGKIRRLIVNLPPRSLKSIICSVAFPAYVLGHDPRKRLICVSYGSELATKLGNDCRSILTSDWFMRTFPHTRISRGKNTEAEVETTRRGFRLAASLGGTLTGRGGDIIIIDDLLKPQDALSDTKREAANEWFYNTLLSRLDDKRTGAIVVVMQRLHQHDLTGMLLQDSKDWVVLSLPAIAERDERVAVGDDLYHLRKVGDVLQAEREPIAVLNGIRQQLGPDIFASQYQQNPIASGKNMINRDWIRRFERTPSRTSSTLVLQSWDTAAKEGSHNDWSVCTTWFFINNCCYLIEVVRGRFNYPALKSLAIAHAQEHKPDVILIEETGVGTALLAELSAAGFSATATRPEQNKVTRMAVQSAKFAAGKVYFPQQALWLEELEAELFAFPGSRHDDQVDSISQALGYQINRAFWDEKSIEGLGRLTAALEMDRYLGRVTGRPW